MNVRQCDGGLHSCTPRACLLLYQTNSERMAAYDELFAWANGGSSYCNIMWMLHTGMKGPCAGFPMYGNKTNTNCGPANTGDIPRMIGCESASTWDATTKADCACHTLR